MFLHAVVKCESLWAGRGKTRCTVTQSKLQFLIIFADTCHLKKYCANRILKKLRAVSKRLEKINMVVDKLQFRNLLDLWCKPYGNPYDRNLLYGVSVSVCASIYIQTLFEFLGQGRGLDM